MDCRQFPAMHSCLPGGTEVTTNGATRAMLREAIAARDAEIVRLRKVVQEVLDWGTHPERAEGNGGEDNAFPAGWWEKAREAMK